MKTCRQWPVHEAKIPRHAAHLVVAITLLDIR